GPWQNNDFTDCFREVVVDAGVLSLYSIVSLCIFITAYLKLRRHNGSDHERLFNSQFNSNYGSIERSGLINDNETYLDISDDNSDYFDDVSNQTSKNMLFDEQTRKLLACNSYIGSHHMAVFNIVSQQRSVLHTRGHLNILYFLSLVSSIIDIHSLYLKLGTDFNSEYYLKLWILTFSFILVCFSILEPQDDIELLSKPNAEGRYVSPEVKCSLYDKITYSWVNPLISRGFRSTLEDKDIFELPSFARAKNILKTFHSSKKPSIIKSLLFAFRKELFIQFIYSISHVTAYSYAFGLFLGLVVPSLCMQQSLYIGRHLSVKCEAIIIGEVYLKSLSRKDTSGVVENDESKNKIGKITNLMAVDAKEVSEFFAYIFQLPSFIQRRFKTIQSRLMTATDKRMGVINELLQAIHIIKFFAWEDHFRAKVMNARDNELKEIKNRLMEWVYMNSLWTTLPLIIMITVFITYTKFLGNDLSAPVAFTALALFNNLSNAFNMMPFVVTYLIQACVSISRIEKFLNEPELNHKNSIQSINDPYIGFKNATLRWLDGEDSIDNSSVSVNLSTQNPSNKFTLINLNVSFPINELSIICGPTESWNELGGAPSGIAYVSQTAWLQNASIRDNILFGLPFSYEIYSEVIRVCALDKDLEILEAGDKTEIGEKGITLSGGQKQPVDSHTAKHIFEQCLMGDLMKNRTRILVTHHVGLCLRGAAKVVIMKDGQISAEGSVKEILATGLLDGVTCEDEELRTSVEDVMDAKYQGSNKNIREGDGRLTSEETRAVGMVGWKYYKLYLVASGGFWQWLLLLLLFVLEKIINVGEDWWIREWTDAYNNISNQIWSFASLLLDKLCRTTNNLALSNILEETLEPINIDYYIWIYVLIGLTHAALSSFNVYYMLIGSLMASKKLHSDMLDKVLSATLRFYDTTPIGRIMNRFSKDIKTVDQIFSNIALGFLQSSIATASVIIVISIVMPQFLIAGAFIAAMLIVIGAYYIATSRDLKRLESVSRSPIYAAFGE
ncbi:19722_t:CDS:10, partial [Racocetra persica]